MSFYLTLSSDGGKETFPNNHGGDFKIQLDHTLDMRSQAWEVALVEMIYTGQAFPNLPLEDRQITLKASGKPQFDNDYIITYDQTFDLWLSFKSERLVAGGRHTDKQAEIHLPKQHYSFPLFAETVKRLCIEQFSLYEVLLTESEFKFVDSNLHLGNIFNMRMSSNFLKLFGINEKYKQIHDHEKRIVSFVHRVTSMPIPTPDTSTVFYTPFAINKFCKLEVEGEMIFKLTLQYWTVTMFKKAINAVGKRFEKDSMLSAMYIEEGPNPENCFLVLVPNNSNGNSKTVKVSKDFKTVFGTNSLEFNLLDQPLRISLSITQSEEDESQWKNYEASMRLQSNYYPTIQFIIDELNEVLTELIHDIAKQRNSSTAKFTFFTLKGDVVQFHGKNGYLVLLSSGLLKLMHLPRSWLTTSIEGKANVIMKSYKRSHLYVHLDCLDYHYINNNVSDLIKIVPNTAQLDEKVLLTFSDPHYYAVANRHMANINMYITDNYFEGILPFERDVAYTLHFRRCPHFL